MSDAPVTRETHSSFEEFWPDYVKAHGNPINQVFHFIATSWEIAFFVLGFVYSFWLWLLIPGAYVWAWAGHFLFEKNKPLTFVRVTWSWKADHYMFILMLTGQWWKEQARIYAEDKSKASA